MILQITTRKIDVYEGNVADVDRKFKTLIMRVELHREKRTTMLQEMRMKRTEASGRSALLTN